jgi:hypothetical protein
VGVGKGKELLSARVGVSQVLQKWQVASKLAHDIGMGAFNVRAITLFARNLQLILVMKPDFVATAGTGTHSYGI